jgi:hypothetical protein
MFENAQTSHLWAKKMPQTPGLWSPARSDQKVSMTPNRQTPGANPSNPDSWAEPNSVAESLAWDSTPPSFHWLSTCAAFADSGGMVSGDELANRLVESALNAGGADGLQAISMVARWIVSRSVVTVMGPHGWMLPMFQFDGVTATPKPSMAPILSELRGVFDEAELALWFVTSNDWLEGDRPAMVMHKNLPGVLHAARADRFLARGH